ncbi:MAG: DNA-directed RNA polymerase subunit omega [Acidobacteria bacterium]|nr:DNA-directed RNA polymerase subunit omega [Acidobacteriota bacterium]MCA1650772.1 DNA-directed RNA polymerase subunit omega [Acidobacteriota bacterium]
MTDRTAVPGRFEFVVVAGARARQLLAGCTPRTTGTEKAVRLAQKEVREGKVLRTDHEDADAGRI